MVPEAEEVDEEEEAAVLVTAQWAAKAKEAEVVGPAGSPLSVLAPPDRFDAGAAAAAGGFALAAAHCKLAGYCGDCGDCGDGQQIVEMVNREVAASLELAAALDEWEIVEIDEIVEMAEQPQATEQLRV